MTYMQIVVRDTMQAQLHRPDFLRRVHQLP
ncbi:hypothetical protein A8990_12257 [Paenibacillus taihuensis]|uniref:Uncharacterized protein n=1 Tax=Paenibacillus taihuensis TaxID=1156355 RepID=A0A3D9RRI2_9BACL|nr:hypothetical protein A8990_12257 [Paenibacillus taihuensis]